MTLQARIQSALSTAKQWDDDPSLLAEIRASIPMKQLVPECVLRLEEDWKQFLAGDTSDVGAAKAPAAAAADGDADESIDIKDTTSKYQRPDDGKYEGDDLLLKRLTRYFKEDVMTWVNRPPCVNPNCKGNEDGKHMESQGVRGPVTEEEKAGRASRVEVYKCQLCESEATFPRHNSPRTLFQTRRGRCGEFANLFGTYCRALGFDTRYILDFTDHVWIEVWSHRTRRWICADSCEGVIDEPGMYEKGWGKKLSYAVGATKDSVADVTRRYTRKFHEDEFQARRREFAPDEASSENTFRLANLTIRQQQSGNISKARLEELDARMKMESAFFGRVAASGVWDSDYNEGRISGSFAWRAARNELGETSSASDDNEKEVDAKNSRKEAEEAKTSESFLVESFYPSSRHEDLVIRVRPPSDEMLAKTPRECIRVSGVPCAATLPNGVSIVVVDELSGCLLQSRAYFSWSGAWSFLATVPAGRIVAISSNAVGKDSAEVASDVAGTIGGLNLDFNASKSSESENSESDFVSPLFTLFVGQIGYYPKWSTCIQTCDENESIQLSIQLNLSNLPKVLLRSERNTVPAIVLARLPEQNMPLKTQIEATNYQKRLAFNAYMENLPTSAKTYVVGYTTKPGAPIYLIGNDAFPFRRADGVSSTVAEKDSWITYHYLPEALVPDDDIITGETSASSMKSTIPKFDIPIHDDYFRGLLGDHLLIKNANNTPTLVDVSNAILNTRLIALYFSAHWCGPCRGFTPLLIEFYNYLKDQVAPTHGLELIFVSSDRDEAQFHQYYQKMPFAAIPFSDRSLAQRIKAQFGVQGIPSLVIIDSLSGRIVVSQDESRRSIHQACQMGESAIESLFHSWLEKVPDESRSMMEILELSCIEAEISATNVSGNNSTTNSKAERYFRRQKGGHDDGKRTPTTKELFAARVKEIFAKLVEEGVEPNMAGAQAIRQASTECKQSLATTLDEGWVLGSRDNYSQDDTKNVKIAAEEMCQLNSGDKSIVHGALVVAKKYVSNARKDPSNPRFRTIRLGNKVCDQITSKLGGVNLLTSLGFSPFHSDIDFLASIPLSMDLELLSEVIAKAISIYAQ